jgi:hypothetical protein
MWMALRAVGALTFSYIVLDPILLAMHGYKVTGVLPCGDE